ncbi:MAG: 50S ribosomal protein L2 [Candidatus Zambryskibacteria bacterium RIFOXYC1_FULL_39_10]|uniref:Large ribosomal subunit protein uL2 n=1 Tax=Candidatus Zambryskibacteria bacterium RIFOXYC1_FULL_39_10 TaxID=1802779 RepID=A0A1G2V455_9BACT|nr:MAG: 50S ribosomal protein L2 [Candidatus Zambryskibacteria bacterium RIFOXYD1_FULL_39_35]OHB16418.1 MAG: 50S ribosomal protein L2 [Candidatus Zambryskibacteria bacterium RIFOXYC1_FULL_39_10]
MAIKTYKPTSKSRRGMTVVSLKSILTKNKPLKALTFGRKRAVGRNSAGRITVRHKGGGHKRLYREIDFKYNKINIPYKIVSVEYDPNRTGFIGQAVYKDGEKRYVLLPKSVKVGEELVTAENAEIKQGNRLPLREIPVGASVYNVELKPKGGARIARSAGNFVQVIAKDAGSVDLKMPSTEIRKVKETCWASIGEVSNEEKRLENYGKAGKSRWKGIRPTVRGTAMNPVDHPHGGGEGRQGRGRRRAISLWGKPTGKGQKSRRSKKYSNKFIVSRRKVGKKR